MFKTSCLAHGVIAAVAFLVAGSAFAEGTFTPELGISKIHGKDVLTGNAKGDASWALTGAFGYELENGLGVRVLAFGDLDPFRGYVASDRSFDNFVGVQATGSYELAPKLNLRGGLGIGRTNLDEGADEGHQIITDGVLSVGLQYRFARHYAMEFRVDHLTSSAVTAIGLQFQVPF